MKVLVVVLLVFSAWCPKSFAQDEASNSPTTVPESTDAARNEPYGKVISSALIEGQPFYVHGKSVSLIRAQDVHVMAVVNAVNTHYGYEEVEIAIRNTGKKTITIDPQTQVSGRADANCESCKALAESPMEAKQVAAIAKKIMRKQMFGVLAAGVVGTASASQYSQYSTMSAYEQERSDDLTDAAAAQSLEQSKGFMQAQFLQTSIGPDQIVIGKLYFDLKGNKKEKLVAFTPQYADMTIDGIVYRLDLKN